MQNVIKNNVPLSQIFAEIILQTLNSQNGDEIHPYLHLVFDFLIFRDAHSRLRWELLLGFPQLLIR